MRQRKRVVLRAPPGCPGAPQRRRRPFPRRSGGRPAAAAAALAGAVLAAPARAAAAAGPEACPEDVWECLPAWRWGIGWNSLVVANAEPGNLAAVESVGGSLFNMIALLPFTLAELVWSLTLTVVKWAVDPGIIPRIAAALQGAVVDEWEKLLRFVGAPGSGGKSVLWALVGLLALANAAWIVARPRTGDLTKRTVTQYGIWYNGFSRLLAALIPLGLLALLAGNLRSPDSVFSPMGLREYVSGKIDGTVTPLLLTAGKELRRDAAAGEHRSACELYEEQLRADFAAGFASSVGAAIPDAPDGTEEIRTDLPVMVSLMWESSYLSMLGAGQFGDPAAAERAMCFPMEWNRNVVTAKTQLRTMYKALGISGGVVHLPDSAREELARRRELLDAAGNPDPSLLPDGVVQGVVPRNAGISEEVLGGDMFRPERDDPLQVSSLLTLAAACGFGGGGEHRPSAAARYGPQEGVGFDSTHTSPTPAEEVTDRLPADVWLRREWTGLQNEAGWAPGDHRNTLSSNVCAAWMFPHIVEWVERNYGNPPAWRMPVGVKSAWVQQHAAIDAGDVERWRERSKRNTVEAVRGTPSLEEVERASRVVEAIRGGSSASNLVYGVWAVVVALAYLKAFGGLSVGFLVAQLILAILFFMLPLLLFVSGLPIEAAGQVRKKLIRLYLATVLSYALFYTVLMMVMLLTDIVSSWLEAMTGGDGFAHMMLIAASPLIALWMLSKGLKLFGMGGMLSVQGAAQLSSGLSAAGMRLPDMKDVAAKTTSVGLRAASIGMKTGSIGMKTTRAGVGATIAGVKGARSVHSDYRQGQARGLTRRNAFSQVMADRARSAYGSVSREAGDFAGWAVTGAGRYVDRTSRLPSVPRPWAERGDQIRAAEAEIADIDRRLGNETGPDPDPPPSGGRPLRTAYQAARDRWNLPEDSNPPSGRPIPDPDPPPSNPPSSGGVLRTAYQAALDNYPDPQPILGPNGRPAGGGNPDPQPILGPNGRPAGGGNPDPQPILGPNGRPAGGGNPDPQPILGPNGRPAGGGNPDPQPILGPNGRPAGGGNPDPSSGADADLIESVALVATVARYVSERSGLTAHRDYLDRQQGALDARRQALQDRRRTLQGQIDDTKKIWGRNTDSRGSSRDSKADGNRERAAAEDEVVRAVRQAAAESAGQEGASLLE